ncbi:PGR5-like protein 1A, chloroplastic [Actinidia eriantha]|uniref:PGR5-like protein 1A, chloroplastic n=1 Tax=Actinidia eriantha TaxID=165200 RepID=UPI002583658E|nr:PGR5-like protein 1A, chloroplastic [Actinidia eriantha]
MRFFFLDDLTGFEITYLLELPEPFSFIFAWFAALSIILWLAFSITNKIVVDFLILKVGSFLSSLIGFILNNHAMFGIQTNKCCYFSRTLSKLWNRKPIVLWDHPINI